MPKISENPAGNGRRLMRCAAVALLCVTALLGVAGTAMASSGEVYVSASGTDASGCGATASPCQTLSYALTLAPVGGTVYVEGTLSQNAAATVSQDVTIAGVAGTGATVEGVSGDADGLLVISSGDVTLQDIVFEDGSNSSGNGSGGIDEEGGGGTLTITNATFTGNTLGQAGHTGDGAAIVDTGSGALTISGSTFSDNIAGYGGGAIYSQAAGLTVTGSTFVGNSAGAYGGAIWDSGWQPSSITDSTFGDNSAADGGGAVMETNGDSSAFVGVTFAGDTASFGNAILSEFTNGAVTVAADVFGDTCATQSYPPLIDAGYNTGVDSSCMNGGVGDDTTMTSGELAGLAGNGGPTQTILPLAGNPAIGLIPSGTSVTVGSGSVSLCPVSADQRGALVPAASGASCDAGAVQTAQKLSQTVTFTSAAPSGLVTADTGTYSPTATASSGETVAYQVDPTTTNSACSVDQSTGVVSFQHAGSCVIDAVAAGADYSTATAQQTIAVAQATTSTKLAGTPNGLTATVAAVSPSGGSPAGTVSFTVGGQTVGTATLSNGTAALAYPLPAGDDQVTAVYAGDDDYATSQGSATVAVTATATTPTTTQPEIWGISTTKSTVMWCIRYGCSYPDTALRFHLGRALTVRLVLLARAAGRWHQVALTVVYGREGADRYRIAGRWHGQLVPERRVEMLVQVKRAQGWTTAKTLHLTVRHQHG